MTGVARLVLGSVTGDRRAWRLLGCLLLLGVAGRCQEAKTINIELPLDGTVFPPEMPPPLFRWSDTNLGVNAWRVRVGFGGGEEGLSAVTERPVWRPGYSEWEEMKRRSIDVPAQVEVEGYARQASGRILSGGRMSFSTSRDAVGAPLFYREVNLPFAEAVKDPSQIRWRFGGIGSLEAPPIVLQQLPVCGNCHSFSRDGAVLGMDVDYANSKGSYAILPTAAEMVLTPEEIITWDDYRREDGELTFGLLSQVSPDGQWVVSTVKDKSVFVPRPDLAFSQLFFPIKGILAVYHRATRRFSALSGADDPAFVQSNPNWSPDGRFIIFARAPAYDLSNLAGKGKVLLTPEECREFVEDGKPFRFDLFRIPFNDGKGGRAEPLTGASADGWSHYFPRYSPDGRWIVFCRSRNYMLLQPDSELFIIPAEGGEPRRLRANLGRMNSWHSWSPNGRWMVFSTKAFSDYTQMALTHIDAGGNTTPPVILEHMTATNRAANIPEFVNLPLRSIARIQERFLNDYSFERAGNEFYRSGDADRAIEQYRQALKLNPGNVTAHQRLGFLLYNVKRQFAEGLKHTAEALRLDPQNSPAHSDYGVAMLNDRRPEEALRHLEVALKGMTSINPDGQYRPESLRYHLAQAHVQLGQFSNAVEHLQALIQIAPNNPEAQYLLGLALVCQGQWEAGLAYHRQAVTLRPAIDTSVMFHELLAEQQAKAGHWGDAARSGERALTLAKAAGRPEVVQRVAASLERYRLGAGSSKP